MAGNQSRGLIIASKTRGWDPTRIRNSDGSYGESMANFDKDPANAPVGPGAYLGRLPQGTPDNFADDHPKIDPNGAAPWNYGGKRRSR